MDQICSYYTPKWQHTSRHSPEKFVEVLGCFYDKYTNTKLEKMKFTYTPSRVSDPDQYKHWVGLKNVSDSWEPCLQETDEEIIENFEYIQHLDIISEKHRPKTSELYEEHEYEINISSFNKLFSLLKMKTDSSSSFDISIENEFDFTDYDYSEFGNLFSWYNFRKGANRIWVFLTNGVELGHQTDKKISTGVKIDLFFPKFTETEKEYLRNIQAQLKIKFSSKGFSFYQKTDKGKLKSKKEMVRL